MLSKKEQIVKEMKDLSKTLGLYEKAFPDNPVFAAGNKKKDNKKKKVQ